MGYKNFGYDFIKRTLDILDEYEASKGTYIVTSLINNCLGLLVLPKELLKEKIPLDILNDSNPKFGIRRQSIKYIKPERKDLQFDNYDEYNVRNVVTHMRNAISHGHIKQELNGEKIEKLNFEDEYYGEITFESTLSVDEFKEFAVLIAREVLESEPKDENS